MTTRLPVLICLTPSLVFCTTTLAGLSQNAIASPGGFLQAGCDPGPTGGGFFWPGYDLAGAIGGAGSMLNESSFVGLSVASQSANSSATNLNNNSSGTAGMGYVLVNAYSNAPNDNQFPLGAINGGWKETFAVSNPNYTGQAGYLVFEVVGSGFLKATGLAGAASVLVTAYKDDNQLMVNQYFSPGNSDLLSTDRQYGNWAIATYGNPTVDSKSFNDTVTMAVPFTFGTPFTLGVYAWGKVGMRSSGGVADNSTALIQDGKVRWGGILNVLAGGISVTATSTVSGSSGKDWGPGTQPPDPCPGDLNNDGFVDDTDFVIFVNAYNILDCADPSMPVLCPADMNSDGVVDDADFVLFAAAYNKLVCT